MGLSLNPTWFGLDRAGDTGMPPPVALGVNYAPRYPVDDPLGLNAYVFPGPPLRRNIEATKRAMRVKDPTVYMP